MLKIVKFTFYLFGINTYVVYDPVSHEAAIIDPGMSRPEEFDAVEKFIARENLKVTHLINTHLHVDHAIADNWVCRNYSVPVEAHEDDAVLGIVIPQQAQRFGIKGGAEKVEIGLNLKDGDVIGIGSGQLKVLHVPGHSPGSVALYDETDRFVIVGDTLFEGSIGRTDLLGGSYSVLVNAINSKLMTLPEDTAVFPGHGDATTVGREQEMNPYF